MIDLEKIIDLLEKKDLSDSENKWLKDIYASDPEAKSIIDTYNSIKYSLNRNEHIDEELLGEYVLYRNGSPEYNKILPFLLIRIEDHLRKCELCQNTFKELNSQYADIDEFVGKSLSAKAEKSYTLITQIIFKEKFNSIRYAITSLVAVVVIYLGLYVYSDLTMPNYMKTPFAEERDFYNTRGRITELFQRGLDALDRKDFETAIKYFNDDLRENPDQESIFYTHFVIGLAYVSKAEKDFLGLFKSFDKDDLLKGIYHFEKSIELNHNDRFQNLKLDAHYYLGKAYLLINDKISAKRHLQTVIDEKGSYYKNAEEILKSF